MAKVKMVAMKWRQLNNGGGNVASIISNNSLRK
jgi:hypothetical protein